MDQKLLGIYLNDHLAGAVAGQQLARRCLASNQETPLGRFLDELVQEIDEDKATLEELMQGLGVRPDPLKRAVAWTAERAARLKPNGRLLSYSPLSRLIELEALSLGVEGKGALWASLREVALDPAAAESLEHLEKRAKRQRRRLEVHRLEAAREALTTDERERPAS